MLSLITPSAISSKLVGLMDVGGGLEELELLALDDKLLVATEGNQSARAARRAGGPVGSKTRKASPKGCKYRLLVRA